MSLPAGWLVPGPGAQQHPDGCFGVIAEQGLRSPLIIEQPAGVQSGRTIGQLAGSPEGRAPVRQPHLPGFSIRCSAGIYRSTDPPANPGRPEVCARAAGIADSRTGVRSRRAIQYGDGIGGIFQRLEVGPTGVRIRCCRSGCAVPTRSGGRHPLPGGSAPSRFRAGRTAKRHWPG